MVTLSRFVAQSCSLILKHHQNVLLRVDPSNSSRLWKLFGSGFPSTPQGATGWACFPGPVYPNATDPGCRSGGDCDKELGGVKQ